MRLIAFALIFLTLGLNAQNDKKNYNLLWEISGNDLEQVSYLFGTMHVKDERAFDFSDSLLLVLDQVDAFAMEVHPDSMVEFLMDMIFNSDTTNVLRERLSTEAYERLDRQLKDKTGKNIDETGIKDPIWIELMMMDFEEPGHTVKQEKVLDFYLFNRAYRQGKATYGLERMRDYGGMTDAFFGMFEKEDYDPEMFEINESEQERMFEQMIKIYASGDIEAIARFSKGEGGFEDEEYEEEILDKRNYRMVDSLELLIRKQSVFNAVGVAHLPGKHGMIEILRKKGYRMRPVKAAFDNTTDLDDFPAQAPDWKRFAFQDFEASVLLPKKPYAIDIGLDDIYTVSEAKMSMDILNEQIYIFAAFHHRALFDVRANESFFENFQKRWVERQGIEIIDSKVIEYKGKKSIRTIYKETADEGQFGVMQLYKKGGSIFMLSVTNENGNFDKELLLHFFESLEMGDDDEPKMHKVVDDISGVSYEMPIKPKHNHRVAYSDEYGELYPFTIHSYLAKDALENFNYLMLQRTNPAGIVYTNLGDEFEHFQNIYEKRFEAKVKSSKRVMFKGFPAIEMIFDLPQSLVHMLIVIRGNRAFIFMVEKLPSGKEFEFKRDAFFDSIEFLPLKYMEIRERKLHAELSIALPSEPFLESKEYSYYPYANSDTYLSLDSLSGVGYSLTNYQMNPYYTSENADSMMQAGIDSVVVDSDLKYFADTTFQGLPAWYLKVFSPESEMLNHQLLFYRGPHFFEVVFIGSNEDPDALAWEYFNTFQYRNPEHTMDYFDRDHKEKLWQDALSRDSAILYDVKYYLLNTDLGREDLPEIYRILETDLSYDTFNIRYLEEILVDQLAKIKEPASIPFLSDLYEKRESKPETQMAILAAFSAMQDETAAAQFFKYIKTFDAEKKNQTNFYVEFQPFKDSLKFARQFTQDFVALIGQKEISYYAIEVLNALYSDTTITMPENEALADALIKQGKSVIEQYDLLNPDTTISYQGDMYDLNEINLILAHFEVDDRIKDYIALQEQVNHKSIQVSSVRLAYKLELAPDPEVLTKIVEDDYYGYYLMKKLWEENTFSKLPDTLYNQASIVKGCFAFDSNYEYGEVKNFQSLERRAYSKNDKNYLIHLVQFDIDGYKIPQIGICTQPARSDEVNPVPDFFTYTDWNSEKESREDAIKRVIKSFEEY